MNVDDVFRVYRTTGRSLRALAHRQNVRDSVTVIAVLHVPSLSFVLIILKSTHTCAHAVLSSIDMKTQYNTAHIIIFTDLMYGLDCY